MAKQKNTDFLGDIQQALAARDAAREALNAITGSERTLEEKRRIGKIRTDNLVEGGRQHLEYFGRAQGLPEQPWTKLFGENNSHAEAVFAALHADELGRIIHQAIEVAHERHVEAGGLVISAADLPGKVAEAEQKLFAAEQALESAYCAAEGAGFTVNRDGDMSPESVLGIERGEILPYDFFSEKAEQLIAARDGAHAAYRAAHDAWFDAKNRLAVVSNPEDIEACEKMVAQRKAALDARESELQAKIKLACAIEDYIRDHRRARPVAQPHAEDNRKPVSMQLKDNGPAPGTIWRDRFEQATGVSKADK